MWLELDSTSGLALSRQIYERLKTLILRGELKAEEKLPSSRALAKELHLARNTVLEAYERLLAEGYLEARRGSGTRVAKGIAAARPAPDKVAAARPGSPSPKADMISFRSGIPDLAAFPRREWAGLYQRACCGLPSSALRYGDPGGVWELREAIANYLFRVRGIRSGPERIMITSGSTQGLWLAARLLRRQRGTVLMEDPGHEGLAQVIARAGYSLQGVPVDEHGLDTSRLPAPDPGAPVAFVYVTPSRQYPLGGILPIRRRQALLDYARAAGCLVLEDDYDSEFRYEGAPVGSLFELAPDEVIYLGSFSKILAPALRLGFAIVPEAMREAWRPEKKYTDVHTDALSQYALAAFISSGGLERHIWKMKKLYRRKREHLLHCLARNFGGRFAVRGEAAGLHLVAAFPGVAFSESLLSELHERGLVVVPVESYSLSRDGTHAHEIILGYSHLSDREMTRGILILAELLKKYSPR